VHQKVTFYVHDGDDGDTKGRDALSLSRSGPCATSFLVDVQLNDKENVRENK
jgi:hypothetical protein